MLIPLQYHDEPNIVYKDADAARHRRDVYMHEWLSIKQLYPRVITAIQV